MRVDALVVIALLGFALFILGAGVTLVLGEALVHRGLVVFNTLLHETLLGLAFIILGA